MVFSSLMFICRFLPAFLGIYLAVPDRYRNLVLFLGSLVFYAWGEPVYIILMLFSAFFDYGNGLILEYAKKQKKDRLAGAVLAGSVLVNLSLLGVFKYSGVLPLPVGISFYTFQTMSYTIDVYRGEVPAQKSLTAFGAYISMFPQLIAGPVVRYKDIAEQLEHRTLNVTEGYEGIGRFCTGLGKKVLLANQIGLLWETVQAVPVKELSVLTAWTGCTAYALQLYFDFSGYSDMAIGMAQMLGFRLKENFQYPYRSESITEFWRRWHISLGQWFRDYVYIPLGGSRRGTVRSIRNLLVVWLLTGIWHGRGWNFLVWGLYFGILIMAEKCFLLRCLNRLPAVFRHLYTVAAVIFGMTIFALDRLPQGLGMITVLLGNGAALWDAQAVWLLSDYGILLAAGILVALGCARKLAACPVVWALAFVLSVAYLVDEAYNPFLYFRF